jgi:hypothetical protein
MTEVSTAKSAFDIDIPEGHGLLHTLDRTGDHRIMWDRDNADEVAASERTFKELTAKGYVAYKAEGKRGEAGTVLKKFDPKAERIILVKQNQGG